MADFFYPPAANRGFISTDPELAAVDASVRWPVMACFLTAVHWMVVGTFLLVYASSLTHPQDTFPILGLLVDLASNCSFFTYGHIWPAAVDALVYGWASTAGLGLAIWLLARMGRTPARAPAALMTGVVFWNLGIATGLTGIFLGDSTGVELLEFPAYASWILWLAYALFALWAVATYLGRKPGQNHIAQAWLLVALFAFPWLYATGSTLLCTDLHSISPDFRHTTSNSAWAYPLPGSFNALASGLEVFDSSACAATAPSLGTEKGPYAAESVIKALRGEPFTIQYEISEKGSKVQTEHEFKNPLAPTVNKPGQPNQVAAPACKQQAPSNLGGSSSQFPQVTPER